MTISDRERLLKRIRQIRRTNAGSDQPTGDLPEPPGDVPEPQLDRLQALEDRVAHLESLLEGFQDSVHREMARHASLIAELQSQVDPAAMGAALAEDVRNRGL